MDPEAIPVAYKPRNVPYHLQKRPLKKWLEQGVEKYIWESTRSSKTKNKIHKCRVRKRLEPKMIRASIDMRVPNQSMNCNHYVWAPRIGNFIYHLRICKIFTKPDLQQRYHHLILHPETRQITTVATRWGNYRPRRSIFGAKSSQSWCVCRSHVSKFWRCSPLHPPARWYSPRRTRQNQTQWSLANSVTARKRSWYHIQQTQVPVRKLKNWILRLHLHKRWTETVTWMSQSS